MTIQLPASNPGSTESSTNPNNEELHMNTTSPKSVVTDMPIEVHKEALRKAALAYAKTVRKHGDERQAFMRLAAASSMLIDAIEEATLDARLDEAVHVARLSINEGKQEDESIIRAARLNKVPESAVRTALKGGAR